MLFIFLKGGFMAFINNTGTTTSTLDVCVSGLDTEWGNGTRYVKWYLNGDFKTEKTISNFVKSGGYYTFNNLLANTTYNISCDISWYDPTIQQFTTLVYLEDSFTTERIVVDNWEWSYSELQALQNKGKVNVITYQRWNDLVNKVNEVRLINSWGWDETNYGELESILMSYSDKILTAKRFNSIRNNINVFAKHVGAQPVNIPVVYSGDIVYGWYFTAIGLCINNCIGML